MFRKSLFLACVAIGMAASGGLAFAGSPDLKPGFNVKTGKLSVTNAGNEPAGRSYATVACTTSVPAGCPDPGMAAAPYENPAFPNRATVRFDPLKAGQSSSHVIAFYKDLVWGPGTYWLTICVDAGDHVAESNEANNCRRFRKAIRQSSTGLAAGRR